MQSKRINHMPAVWWYVMGRKNFDTRYSSSVRAMWQVGNYGNYGKKKKKMKKRVKI